MDIKHPGNWTRPIHPLHDVFECPICFALTREPMDHADYHLKHGTAWTSPAASRVRQVGQQQ